MAALVGVLAEGQPSWRRRPLLVPVPSWKRQGNPLPTLLCRQLGQHHLNRSMRLANQEGAFRCRRRPRPGEATARPILIVDDILTSGATACSAAEALESMGWPVVGLVCLARTPSGRSRNRP